MGRSRPITSNLVKVAIKSNPDSCIGIIDKVNGDGTYDIFLDGRLSAVLYVPNISKKSFEEGHTVNVGFYQRNRNLPFIISLAQRRITETVTHIINPTTQVYIRYPNPGSITDTDMTGSDLSDIRYYVKTDAVISYTLAHLPHSPVISIDAILTGYMFPDGTPYPGLVFRVENLTLGYSNDILATAAGVIITPTIFMGPDASSNPDNTYNVVFPASFGSLVRDGLNELKVTIFYNSVAGASSEIVTLYAGAEIGLIGTPGFAMENGVYRPGKYNRTFLIGVWGDLTFPVGLEVDSVTWSGVAWAFWARGVYYDPDGYNDWIPPDYWEFPAGSYPAELRSYTNYADIGTVDGIYRAGVSLPFPGDASTTPTTPPVCPPAAVSLVPFSVAGDITGLEGSGKNWLADVMEPVERFWWLYPGAEDRVRKIAYLGGSDGTWQKLTVRWH